MKVQLNQTCGRCRREDRTEMDLEEAQELAETDEARHEAEKGLSSLLNDTLTENHPDVITAIRGGDGRYVVNGLRNLCDVPGAKRNKGCKSRVSTLLDEMYMVVDPSKPKKKPVEKKKPEEDSRQQQIPSSSAPPPPPPAGNKPTGPKAVKSSPAK